MLDPTLKTPKFKHCPILVSHPMNYRQNHQAQKPETLESYVRQQRKDELQVERILKQLQEETESRTSNRCPSPPEIDLK